MYFVTRLVRLRAGLRRCRLFAYVFLALIFVPTGFSHGAEKQIAYLVSDLRIPFWNIMKQGIEARAKGLGYRLDVHSAENDAKRELELAVRAISNKVDGMILSPTNSSAAVTILKLARQADIPVVIADIGTDVGTYVSYIASDNQDGAYQIGRILVQAMQERKWSQGSVGIIAIPQKRANGRDRTAGFLKALEDAGIRGANIRQQVDFTYRETYDFARELLVGHPDMRALWLQGSDRYQAALDAIRQAGRGGQVLLICFDAEPEFIELIQNGTLVGAGMQQPYLMGEESVNAVHAHLAGKSVPRSIQLPVLAVSQGNIRQLLPTIRRNVLGLEGQ
ncbi:MAG: substrate-binding domain-containing protein [Thiobacillus sp.]|nr:substrate-binding domain-containing protein [Thiobacillus sp.]